MILETVRSVTDALTNATYGVNAKLLTLQLDGSDPRPPTVALIEDETRSGAAARGDTYAPSAYPALVVNLYQMVDLMPEPMTTFREGHIPISIRYVTQNADTQNGLRNSYYVMRTVEQTLRAYTSNDNAADRSRNGINIEYLTKLSHYQSFQVSGDQVVTAALVATFFVRDTNP